MSIITHNSRPQPTDFIGDLESYSQVLQKSVHNKNKELVNVIGYILNSVRLDQFLNDDEFDVKLVDNIVDNNEELLKYFLNNNIDSVDALVDEMELDKIEVGKIDATSGNSKIDLKSVKRRASEYIFKSMQKIRSKIYSSQQKKLEQQSGEVQRTIYSYDQNNIKKTQVDNQILFSTYLKNIHDFFKKTISQCFKDGKVKQPEHKIIGSPNGNLSKYIISQQKNKTYKYVSQTGFVGRNTLFRSSNNPIIKNNDRQGGSKAKKQSSWRFQKDSPTQRTTRDFRRVQQNVPRHRQPLFHDYRKESTATDENKVSSAKKRDQEIGLISRITNISNILGRKNDRKDQKDNKKRNNPLVIFNINQEQNDNENKDNRNDEAKKVKKENKKLKTRIGQFGKQTKSIGIGFGKWCKDRITGPFRRLINSNQGLIGKTTGMIFGLLKTPFTKSIVGFLFSSKGGFILGYILGLGYKYIWKPLQNVYDKYKEKIDEFLEGPKGRVSYLYERFKYKLKQAGIFILDFLVHMNEYEMSRGLAVFRNHFVRPFSRVMWYIFESFVMELATNVSASIGSGIGAAIGLFLPIPGGSALGASIGSFMGSAAGVSIANSFLSQFSNVISKRNEEIVSNRDIDQEYSSYGHIAFSRDLTLKNLRTNNISSGGSDQATKRIQAIDETELGVGSRPIYRKNPKTHKLELISFRQSSNEIEQLSRFVQYEIFDTKDRQNFLKIFHPDYPYHDKPEFAPPDWNLVPTDESYISKVPYIEENGEFSTNKLLKVKKDPHLHPYKYRYIRSLYMNDILDRARLGLIPYSVAIDTLRRDFQDEDGYAKIPDYVLRKTIQHADNDKKEVEIIGTMDEYVHDKGLRLIKPDPKSGKDVSLRHFFRASQYVYLDGELLFKQSASHASRYAGALSDSLDATSAMSTLLFGSNSKKFTQIQTKSKEYIKGIKDVALGLDKLTPDQRNQANQVLEKYMMTNHSLLEDVMKLDGTKTIVYNGVEMKTPEDFHKYLKERIIDPIFGTTVRDKNGRELLTLDSQKRVVTAAGGKLQEGIERLKKADEQREADMGKQAGQALQDSTRTAKANDAQEESLRRGVKANGEQIDREMATMQESLKEGANQPVEPSTTIIVDGSKKPETANPTSKDKK